MNISLVYIEDQLLDLSDDNISITINGYDFNNPTTRSVNFSSTFKGPFSDNNILLLGYSNNLNSLTVKPYRFLPCKYMVEGIEHLSEGLLQITKSDNSFSFVIFDSQKSLFDTIQDVKLNTLTYLTNGPYKNADINSFVTATTGIVSPVIDWGVATIASIQPDYYLPTWFYHDLVRESLGYTGLTLEGDILSHTDFTDLVIPFSRDAWEYPIESREQWAFYAINSFNTVTTVTVKIGVSHVVTQGSLNLFDPPSYSLQMPNLGATGNYITYHLKGSIRYTSTGAPGNSFYFRMVVLRAAAEITIAEKLETMVAPGGGGEFVLESDFNLQDDDEVYLKYYTNSGSPTVTITNVIFQGENTGRIHDNWVFFNYLLPDMTMGELINDFTNRFGIIYRQVNEVLICKTLQEVMLDRSNSLDWTDKRVKDIDPIDFKVNYAQSNSFEYANGVEDNETLGFGYLTIDNETLDTEETLFSSPFENSVLNNLLFINLGRIPVYEEFNESFGWDQVNNVGGFVQLQFNSVDRTENFPVGSVVKITSTGGLYLDVYGEITASAFSTNTLITLNTAYLGAAGSGGTAHIVDRGAFEDSPGLKLMTLRDRLSTEQSMTMGAGNRSDYRVAFFDDPTYETKTTGFQYFVDTYYPNLSEALQKSKSIDRRYRLNQMDIYEYNNQRIIFDTDSYFILNSIRNFVPGVLSKAKMLKI